MGFCTTEGTRDNLAWKQGNSANFAVASIASDMAGYRSRLFIAQSKDGISWIEHGCVAEGSGYNSDELNAAYAEDMSLIEIEPAHHRIYCAACNRGGNWRMASAVNE